MRTECVACGKHLFTINDNELVCLNTKCERYDKILIIHDEFDTDLSDDPYYDVDGEVLD